MGFLSALLTGQLEAHEARQFTHKQAERLVDKGEAHWCGSLLTGYTLASGAGHNRNCPKGQ